MISKNASRGRTSLSSRAIMASPPTRIVTFEPRALPQHYKVSDLDILCGRGKGSRNHVGNKRYKDIIKTNLKRYSNAQKKIEKSAVVASIVELLRGSGTLFVKKDSATCRWYDIGDTQAREKTGHAIRDYLAKVSRQNKLQSSLRSTAVHPPVVNANGPEVMLSVVKPLSPFDTTPLPLCTTSTTKATRNTSPSSTMLPTINIPPKIDTMQGNTPTAGSVKMVKGDGSMLLGSNQESSDDLFDNLDLSWIMSSQPFLRNVLSFNGEASQRHSTAFEDAFDMMPIHELEEAALQDMF